MTINCDQRPTSAARRGDDERSNDVGHRRKLRHRLFRPAADAAIAFAVFVAVAAAIPCPPLSASPRSGLAVAVAATHAPLAAKAIADEDDRPAVVEIATTSSAQAPNAVFKRTSLEAAWALIALAFSVLTALNLAMVRHVRQTYASPVRQESLDD